VALMPPRQGVPRAEPNQGQSDGRSVTMQYRDFSTGLVRAGSRSGIPDTALWDCTNGQVIGPGEILTLVGPAPPIVSALSPAVASLWGVILKLSGAEASRLIAVRADGSVSSVDPATGAVVAVCGAGVLSSGARATLWRDTHVLFADPVKGYASWDGTTFILYPGTFVATVTNGLTTITVTGGTIPASALVPGMDVSGTGIPAGSTILSVVGSTVTITATATASNSGVTVTVGTGAPTTPRDLAVFEGRVWLVTGTRGLTFTGPGSFTAFSTVNAGGTAVLTDPVFLGQITTIEAAMQLLWVVGPNAINTISNVQVISGVTTFQNDNLVAGAGTPFADSVKPLFRTLVFLADSGVYAILGATPQKLSDQLDSLFSDVEGLGSAPAGVFTLNKIQVYGVLVTISGAPKLLVYSRPTWAVCDQGADLLWVAPLVRTTGDMELWGTNGTAIFQCFAGATGDAEIAFKAFDYDDLTRRKTIRRCAVETDVVGPGDSTIALFYENESVSHQQSVTTAATVITWINDSATPITWVNDSAGPLTWIASGRIVLLTEGQFSGNLIGLRLKSMNSPPTIIGAFAWEVGASGPWVF
jgi:hypothetical protein